MRGEQDQKSDIPKEWLPTTVSTGMEKVRASNSVEEMCTGLKAGQRT